MKLLLVDLDDTLIDTVTFKSNIFNNLATKLTIPPTLVHQLYDQNKQTHGVRNWLANFTQLVSTQTHISATEIEKIILETMNSISVNAAVLRYVKAFEGYKVIFSQGDDTFQRKKISVAQLHLHVDEVLVTHDDKLDFLTTFVHDKEFILHNKSYSDVTIIDNLSPLLDRINMKFPWMHIIKTANIPA